MNRTAVLSLDIEDWYHLNYFFGLPKPAYSMLDGIDVYQNILTTLGVPSSYFIVGELIESLAGKLKNIAAEGGDIGVHGWNHKLPLTMTESEFEADLFRAKQELENVLGQPVIGYRAPCYSLDRQRLDIVNKLGFKYDSSRIDFSAHTLYGNINIEGFKSLSDFIYEKDNFFEFELSTLKFYSKRIPVSGGGYLRIFPWWIMKGMIKRYISSSDCYIFYIHPFELSRKRSPAINETMPFLTKNRFQYGLGTVEKKLINLISMLKDEGFTFTTFASLRQQLLL